MPQRVLLLVAMAAVASGCTSGPGTSTAVTPTSGGVVTAARSPGSVTGNGALVHTGLGPVGLTVDSRGRVWVANAGDGTVSRLDPVSDSVDLTRRVGSAPLRMTATAGSVWVTVFDDGTLLRLNDRTGAIMMRLRVGAEPEGVTAAFGSIWVVLQTAAQLVRVNPDSGTVTGRYSVGVAPRLVTAGDGALWVSDFGSGRILRIDPTTGLVRRSASVCQGPQGMQVLASVLWVACTTDDVLVGVDTSNLSATSRLALAGSPDAVVAGARGELLVALQKGPTLAVIDPADLSVVRRVQLGTRDQLYDRANIDVVVVAGRAWLSSYLGNGVFAALAT